MEIMFWTIIIGLVVAYLVIDTVRYLNMPGPTKYPIIGNLPQMVRNKKEIVKYYTKLVLEREDRTVQIRVPGKFLHVTADLANVEYINKLNWKNFIKGNGAATQAFKDLAGNGIVIVDGAIWEEQRKVGSRQFTANRFRNHIGVVFANKGQKMSDKIAEKVAQCKDGPMDLTTYLFQFTLDAFGLIAMGKEFGTLDGNLAEFGHALDEAFSMSIARFFGSHPLLWKAMRALNLGSEARLQKHLAVINQVVYACIAERRARPSDELAQMDDLLSRLMDLADGEGKTDDKYLRDMLVVFFVAGRDTTSVLLSWMFHSMMQNAEVEARLLEEVHTQLCGSLPNWDNLKDCHYLQGVVSETLRLYPPIPMGSKMVYKDDVLPSGHRVYAGDTTFVATYAMARDPALWVEPAAFRPERWLDKEGKYRRLDNPFQMPVFGGGPRVCLGMDMAQFEAKVAMALLVRRFKFWPVPGKPVYTDPGFMKMVGGLWVTVEPRAV